MALTIHISRLANKFCSAHHDVSKSAHETYSASDVQIPGYKGWEFDLKWDASKGGKCEHTCEQFFKDGF